MNHWYDNTISQGILKEKYYHKGEKTPQEFMDRVSSIFDPELKKRIRGYLEDTSFCPAGRTLYAAGAKGKFKVSMSNCYILPSPEDNLESIGKSLSWLDTELARQKVTRDDVFWMTGTAGGTVQIVRKADTV